MAAVAAHDPGPRLCVGLSLARPPILTAVKQTSHLPLLSRQAGSAARQVRLHTLLFSEPTWLCASALGRRLARGSRTVDDCCPGENLSSLSVGGSTQPILYKDGARTMLGYILVSPVSPGPCMSVDSDL